MYKFTISDTVAANEFKRFGKREQEVLRAVLMNETTAKACLRLGMTPSTFHTHKYRVFEKLNLLTEREFIYWALTCGLLVGEVIV